MKLNNNCGLKSFAEDLVNKLSRSNELEFVNEICNWSSDVFTTSAEYLGEFMLVLEKIIYVQALDQSTRDDVSECISAIKKSFGI